jgi:hypothetical protein
MALLEGMGKMTAQLGQRGRKGLMAMAIAALFLLNLNGALAASSASISGYVWYDDNGNTVWDEAESGLAGVTVELYNVLEPGNTYTRTTAEDGSYQFTGLPAGDYIVQVSETVTLGLAEYALTTDNPLPISLEEGEKCSDANFGYEALASTGGPAEPTAVTLSSFMASSGLAGSASQGTSFHWPWLAVLATLAAGGSLWIRRIS